MRQPTGSDSVSQAPRWACTRTQGAAAGTGTNAVASAVDLGIPLYRADSACRIDNEFRPSLDLKDHNFSADITHAPAR